MVNKPFDKRELVWIVTILLGIVLVGHPTPTLALKTAVLPLTEDLEFTLVYGDDEAKMNHTEAENYCVELGDRKNVTGKQYVESHLMSQHSEHMARSIMEFVLHYEHRQFWIGCEITKVMHRNRQHYIVHWTDATEDNFRFMHSPSETLGRIPAFDTHCCRVEYLSGYWSAARCSDKSYFVCETRRIDPEEVLRRAETLKEEPPAGVAAAAGAAPVTVDENRGGPVEANAPPRDSPVVAPSLPVERRRPESDRARQEGNPPPPPPRFF